MMWQPREKVFKKTFFLIPIAIFILATNVNAQDSDFGTWFSSEVGLKLIPRVKAFTAINLRTFHNSSSFESFFPEAGVSYDFNKYVGMAAMYRFIIENQNGEQNETEKKHRWSIDLDGTVPVARVKIKPRVRYQEQYQTEQNADAKRTLRTKVGILYDWPSCPFDPFISAEYFFKLKSSTNEIDKNRYKIGLEYNMRFSQTVEASFVVNNDINPYKSSTYILSISYKKSLRFGK